jgi:hypothetical protein
LPADHSDFIIINIKKWHQEQINKVLPKRKLSFKSKLVELNELKDLNIQRED